MGISCLKGIEDFNLEHWSRSMFKISKPSYEIHFEGLSNFSPLIEGLVPIQDVNTRI